MRNPVISPLRPPGAKPGNSKDQSAQEIPSIMNDWSPDLIVSLNTLVQAFALVVPISGHRYRRRHPGDTGPLVVDGSGANLMQVVQTVKGKSFCKYKKIVT